MSIFQLIEKTLFKLVYFLVFSYLYHLSVISPVFKVHSVIWSLALQSEYVVVGGPGFEHIEGGLISIPSGFRQPV